MHKDGVVGVERETIEQLEGGRAGQWNRGRLDDIKHPRARANPIGIKLYVLGVCTPAGAANRTHGPDRLSAREPSNTGSDLLDPARALITHHVRGFDSGPTRVGAIGRIYRIHSDRPDSHKHAPSSHGRTRKLR